MNRIFKLAVAFTLAFAFGCGTLSFFSGCTPEQQEAITPIVNPDSDGDGVGALDKLVTTPLPQLEEAAETYVAEVAAGLASLTIVGLAGLFTPKPGTKRKLDDAQTEGFAQGLRTSDGTAKKITNEF